MQIPWQVRSAVHRAREKALLEAMFAAPSRLKDRIVLHRIGELSTTRRLETTTVGLITVDELIAAMKDREL